MYLTTYMTEKPMRRGMILVFLVASVFLSSCASVNSYPEAKATLSQSDNQLEETNIPQITLIVPDATGEQSENTSTADPNPAIITTTTELTPFMASPTSMPEATLITLPSALTPMPTPVTSPGMMIASVNSAQDEEGREVEELWLIDSRTQEKQLLFAGAPNATLTSLKWGEVHPNTLYVTEVRGLGTGNLTWQLYEINFETGVASAFFTDFIAGYARLLDLSFQGKWLRILVEHPPSADIGDTWFVNAEEGTEIVSEHYFAGFIWSPNNPDIFAHTQNFLDIVDEDTTYSVLTRELPSQEILDTIEYRHTNWTGEPFLLWHVQKPNQIMYLIHNQLFVVDLIQRNWTYVTGHLQFNPEDEFTISPSGKWLLITSRQGVEAIQLEYIEGEVYDFLDYIEQRHWFLSWYGDNDWAIVLTEDRSVVIYELSEEPELVEELNLQDYEISPPSATAVLVEP